MKKVKSPKARLIISSLKLLGITLLVAFVVWLAKCYSVHPAFMAFLILFAGSVIRFLYRMLCIIAAVVIFILIIGSLCLI